MRQKRPAPQQQLLNLWIVRTNDPHAETLLGKVQSDLYLLAFTSAVRANACMAALSAHGSAFYVCGANVEAVVQDARASGVRGFIVDYDPARACFVSAHALPASAAASRELR
jgi:hypothetical protein